MRFLTAVVLIASFFMAPAPCLAGRPVSRETAIVTNKTPFAIRVRLELQTAATKTALLQPEQSVQTTIRSNNKDDLDTADIRISATGLEPPVEGAVATFSAVLVRAIEPPFTTYRYEVRFSADRGLSVVPATTTPPPDSADTLVLGGSVTGLLLLGWLGTQMGRSPRKKPTAPNQQQQ